MIFHDVIVVGGGLAGLRAAIEINCNNVKVGVISKIHPIRSHSVSAQGGINAALGNHPRGGYDSPEKHAFDTIKGSDYLADQDAVMRLTGDAPKRIYEMENWGCPFSRTEEGKIAQRPFGGAGFPRTAYGADRTGHYLLHTLYEQAIKYEQTAERGEFKMYDEWLATSLVVDDGVCQGVIAMNLTTGKLEAFKADAVIFATGGSGRMYGNTTNALSNTGMGMAIPFRAGVPLKDMEFIQFHPTSLIGTNILMTEGCRGEGGYLLNNKGERFLDKYADSRKAMEIAPRDIVARNMTREIQAGNGFEDSYLHLDLRHLGEARILERLPGIRDLCLNFLGIDPIKDPIPVQPGMHYTMGGIDVDKDCKSKVQGFYAAGEASCISVHGANRLGGNSLLETIVFGAVAGESAAQYVLAGAGKKNDKALEDGLKKDEERIQKLMDAEGKENSGEIKEALKTVMKDKVGIFREEKALTEALAEVKKLQERFNDVGVSYKGRRANTELMWTLELKGSLDVAEAVVAGALARKESRGSQFRTDFPQRDDKNWLKHTLATYDPAGAKLDYSPVTLGYFEPKERKY